MEVEISTGAELSFAVVVSKWVNFDSSLVAVILKGVSLLLLDDDIEMLGVISPSA